MCLSVELNPADLATRDKAVLSVLGPNSFWQKGPSFLGSRRDTWPVTRDFTRPDVPDEEVRSKSSLLTKLRAAVMSSQSAVCKLPGMPALWSAIVRVTEYSNSIQKVIRILAKLSSQLRMLVILLLVSWKLLRDCCYFLLCLRQLWQRMRADLLACVLKEMEALLSVGAELVRRVCQDCWGCQAFPYSWQALELLTCSW